MTIFLNPIRHPIFFLETQKINYEAVAEMKAEAACDLKVAFDWMHYKGKNDIVTYLNLRRLAL